MTKAKELKEWFEAKRSELKAAGVHTVEARHHGEGDEGEFDGVTFDGDVGKTSLTSKEEALIEEAVEELCGGFSVDGYPGAGGELVCDVETGKITYTAYYEELVTREEEPVIW